MLEDTWIEISCISNTRERRKHFYYKVRGMHLVIKQKVCMLQSIKHKEGTEGTEKRKRCPVLGTGMQCSAVITTQTHCVPIEVLTLIPTFRENENRLQIVKTIFKRRDRIEEFTPLGFQNPVQSYGIWTVVLVSRQTYRPKQWN